MTRETTTLELARVIADAVIRAYVEAHHKRSSDDARDAPTQAVLRTLERRRRWFMRYEVDEHGVIVGGTERKLP